MTVRDPHLPRQLQEHLAGRAASYDYVAETVFSTLDVDGFFLEFDDERSGGFEPLRFVPKGKKVVLGLVSSKSPQLESKDALKRRIEAASKFVPLENLCLSPAVRLLQHAPRQQPHRRAGEGQAEALHRHRERGLGRAVRDA